MPRIVAAPVFHALQQTVVALPEHIIALVPRHETSLCDVAQRQSAVHVVAPHFAHLSTRFYAASVHRAPVLGVHHQVIAFLIHRLVIQQHTACQHGQSAGCVPRRVCTLICAELSAGRHHDGAYFFQERVAVCLCPTLIEAILRA